MYAIRKLFFIHRVFTNKAAGVSAGVIIFKIKTLVFIGNEFWRIPENQYSKEFYKIVAIFGMRCRILFTKLKCLNNYEKYLPGTACFFELGFY